MPSQRRLLFLNISQMGADAPRIPATVKAATQQSAPVHEDEGAWRQR